MNFRLQLSPISGFRDQVDLPTRERAGQHVNWEETKFYRSWLVYDPDLEPDGHRGLNWNIVLGLALAVVVSVSFWVGVGLLVARLWE
jgi:hypothetical protein